MIKYFLFLEIESPRGARQLKGDTSVVLEGSDGLEEIDKFLGDKVCNLSSFCSCLCFFPLVFYTQVCTIFVTQLVYFFYMCFW